MGSYRLEGVPTNIDVCDQKNGPEDQKLLVFVSQQIVTDSYISIIEFDLLNNFKSREVHHFKSPRPQIVKLMYHEKCGLIIACFRGFIQVYDKVSFAPKWKWENHFKSITHEDNKKKEKEAEAKK